MIDDGDGETAENSLRAVRALIAARMLAPEAEEAPLGDVVLRPHQLRALARVRALLARHRGALLAEEVGVGKTYVAAAVARRFERVVVVAPASLRSLWERSLQRTAVRAHIDTLERLSRTRHIESGSDADLVVIDEAHHLRNPRTRRYAAVAAMCDRAAVLLLSATPVQNRREDLASQLALFLGDAAWSMADGEIARFIVRRVSDAASGQLPALDGPHWIHLSCTDDLLDAIVGLPPAVPGSDEGDGSALVIYGLLRQWASSRAAFVEALRRRIARAAAMRAGLESGRWPGRRELAAWTYADGAMQLAFPELLMTDTHPACVDSLLPVVSSHEQALVDLLALARRHPDPDDARADALRDIRARHAGARIIAFSEYRETVRAIARRLLKDGGIAELTAGSARVAGGRVTRQDVLAQLAPNAAAVPAGERIELLVTTDVLSEGLDLQGASVVVHLDLPWNPARLEQRVGRVRRLGSPHAVVSTYAFAPPAPSERVLCVEARLRNKLRVAGRIVGSGLAVLPEPGGAELFRCGQPAASGAAEATSEALGMLSAWRERLPHTERSTPVASSARRLAFAAVAAPCKGFLGLLDDVNGPLLVADLGDGPTLDGRTLAGAVRHLEAHALVATEPDVAAAVATITAWWAQRRGGRSLGLHTPMGARVRARLASRIDKLLDEAPRHERARVAVLASRARLALRAPLTAASERALAAHALVERVDEDWLRRIIEMTTGGERAPSIEESCGSDPGRDTFELLRSAAPPLMALVLLRADAPARETPLGQRRGAQPANDETGPRADTER